jgi:hypothetical protein
MNIGSRAAVFSDWSTKDAVTPPTLTSMPLRSRRRQHVVPETIDQVLGGLALRRAGRNDRDQAGVAGAIDLRRHDEGDTVLPHQLAAQAIERRRRIVRTRQLCRKQQRRVRARTEPLADQLIRGPSGGALAVVAGVREPQAQAQRGARECDQHRRADDRRRPRAPLHDPAPPCRR